ncbi:MAG: hypothetical protein K5930_03755 [Treponemataceae bacterium]|nr:hypothetical protein [Treponemataceae bacterium]
MKIRFLLFFLSVFAAVALVSCNTERNYTHLNEDGVMEVFIDPELSSPFNRGEFQGWGTSFCWWANRIGYSDLLAQKAAELFYSEEGLGLNIIRYNIGGGDDPTHNHITRTDSEIPGFLVYEGDSLVYDWTRDADQRNVMKKAIEACGQDVIVEAFSNSPPYFMTNSGCSSGAVIKSKDNLRKDMYDAFADYLSEVVKHYRDVEGISFQSLSPMNEPSSDYWGALSWKQEGCHFDIGTSQSKMLVAQARSLERYGLSDVILCGSDETSIDTARISYNMLTDEAKSMLERIDTHSYQGSKRKELMELAVKEGKNLWMSEVDGGDTVGRKSGEMGAALWFADRILEDMNQMMPSAWITWQVIDNHVSAAGLNGKKDSGMPDLSRGYWGCAVCDHDTQEIILTKKYYAFGQFSKFIRPGSTIIGSSEKTLAAYDGGKKRLVIVAVNDGDEELPCLLDLSAFRKTGDRAEVIRTSGSMASGENWAYLPDEPVSEGNMKVTLVPYSVTTFVIDGVER